MHHLWADRGITAAAAVLLVAGCSGLAFGQVRGGTSGAPGPGGNPGGLGTTRTPGSPNSSNGTFGSPDTGLGIPQRTIPLSGRVMFDDGTPPNHEIRIEKVCGGSPIFEAYTDSKGRFSFSLDNTMQAGFDSADEESNQVPGMNGQQTDNFPAEAQRTGTSQQQGMANAQQKQIANGQQNRYWNCELRAAYPGYRSDLLELGTRRALDDPNIGTIILHRLGNVRGSTISLTSALAPKHAQKEYQKGEQLIEKGKLDEAEQHLESATDAYPKYADAWFALGKIHQQQNQLAEAQKCFQSAAEADPKFVSPYNSLAYISGQKGEWAEAAKYSAKVVDLDAVEFPSAYWLNALANYNLKKVDEAEKSAASLVKVDTAHRFPMAEMMLAQINLNKGNLPEAELHLKNYLALEPNAKNADSLKQELSKMEQAKSAPRQQQ